MQSLAPTPPLRSCIGIWGTPLLPILRSGCIFSFWGYSTKPRGAPSWPWWTPEPPRPSCWSYGVIQTLAEQFGYLCHWCSWFCPRVTPPTFMLGGLCVSFLITDLFSSLLSSAGCWRVSSCFYLAPFGQSTINSQ